jgi:hypothetical protein
MVTFFGIGAYASAILFHYHGRALRVTFTSEVNRAIFSVIVILIALFVPGGIKCAIEAWRRHTRPASAHEPAKEEASQLRGQYGQP